MPTSRCNESPTTSPFMNTPELSIIIVSFNTCNLLRECLQLLQQEAHAIPHEIIVIDNASRDGSADMVAAEFSEVILLRSAVNLGFGAANNLGFAKAQGRYVVLLNSDAFVKPNALQQAIKVMDAHPRAGLAGACLVGRDGGWQPSARLFPNLLNHVLTISGLAAKYPNSRFFGRVDFTWSSPQQAIEVDWVPGAFSIIRRDVLETVGYFDEIFFLYYEEVDLCWRIKQQGYQVWYFPEIEIIHLGGESAKTLLDLNFSQGGKQVTLWQFRSALLFYRKHHGWFSTWLWLKIEILWHRLRIWKNKNHVNASQRLKAENSQVLRQLLKQAWEETQGGKLSPPRPW